MNVTVREVGPFERMVGFELTEAEIESAKAAAARRLSRDLKLKGFRPGKAPRPVVEAAIGSERLRAEAIDDVIPVKLGEVLSAESIVPAVAPSLHNVSDVSGGVAVEVKVTLWPKPAAVPPYRDRQVEIEAPVVSDEELEERIRRILEQFGQLAEADRPAQEGDFVSVDVRASADGEEVAEAAATELLYRIGSQGFIEGIDQALVGRVAGDEVKINAPLPFGERAGEMVDFVVTVNEVKELILPELTDEWVDENTEFETVETLRAQLRARVEEMKRATLARRFADRALGTLLDQLEVEIPEAVLRAEMDEILHRFLHRLEEQQVGVDEYLAATGMTEEALLTDVALQADRRLRTRILLEAVAEDAGLTVEDSEIDSFLHAAASESDDPMGFLRAVRTGGRVNVLRGDMLRDKALKLILDNATAVDPEGNPLDLEAAAGGVGAEALEGEIVEGEIVEGEVIAAATVDQAGTEQES